MSSHKIAISKVHDPDGNKVWAIPGMKFLSFARSYKKLKHMAENIVAGYNGRNSGAVTEPTILSRVYVRDKYRRRIYVI